MFLFGMKADEVEALQKQGYHPQALYTGDPHIHRAVDAMFKGFVGAPLGKSPATDRQ